MHEDGLAFYKQKLLGSVHSHSQTFTPCDDDQVSVSVQNGCVLLQNKHRIAIAQKAILLFYCRLVGFFDGIKATKCAGHHVQS